MSLDSVSNEPEHPRSEAEDQKCSQATELVRLAEARYRFATSNDHHAFAVPLHGPSIALSLDGGRGLRAELAAAYYDATGKTPNRTALLDAAAVLEGRAQASGCEELALRVHQDKQQIVVDLGSSDGTAVVIYEGEWRIVN